MATTYITFDTRSGQILSADHGTVDAKESWRGAQYQTPFHRQHDATISDEHVAVIAVPSDAVELGKQYKVDVSRKALVAVESKEGVGFGFGVTGRSY